MSLVTGNYYDLAYWNMGAWFAEISFHLSEPATVPIDKRLVSGSKKHSVMVTQPASEWSMYVTSTEGMAQDRKYRVTATYLDGEKNPIGFEEFPWEIRVPEGTWAFTDLVRDWSSPIAVGISTEPPSLLPEFWLDPETDNFYRRKA